MVFNELVENIDQKVFADNLKTSFDALQVVTESQQLISENRFFQTVHFKEPAQDRPNQSNVILRHCVIHHVPYLASLCNGMIQLSV